MRTAKLMASSVDDSGRHTVFLVCDDNTFWQFDPHTDTYNEFPPITQEQSRFTVQFQDPRSQRKDV